MKERNASVDLIRILTIFMVVVIHILHHGYLLEPAVAGTAPYRTAWFLNYAVYPAVNIFGIITGYVMIRNQVSVSRFISLIIQVLFYSIVLSTIFFIWMPGEYFNKERVLNAFFPIARNQWWYFTAYAGLFLFLPFINNGLKHLNRHIFRNGLIAIFVFYSVAPLLFLRDIYHTYEGFSPIWLLILYLFGCYFGKYQVGKDSCLRYLFLYLGGTVSIFLLHLFLDAVSPAEGAAFEKIALVKYQLSLYTSPFILVSAIGLFLFLVNLRINPTLGKAITFLSQASFGVYLLHDHPLVRKQFIYMRFTGLLEKQPLAMVGQVLLTALMIYSICTIIDLLRTFLFKKLRIREFSSALTIALSNLLKIKLH